MTHKQKINEVLENASMSDKWEFFNHAVYLDISKCSLEEYSEQLDNIFKEVFKVDFGISQIIEEEIFEYFKSRFNRIHHAMIDTEIPWGKPVKYIMPEPKVLSELINEEDMLHRYYMYSRYGESLIEKIKPVVGKIAIT